MQKMHIWNSSIFKFLGDLSLITCNVSRKPAAGFFCCKTFGDVFRSGEYLRRNSSVNIQFQTHPQRFLRKFFY